MKKLALIALAVAGIIHLYISPSHYSHAPAHGIFFALSGTAQIVWAIAAMVRTNRAIHSIGIALSGGMIVLWLLTQVWTPPFAKMAEPIDIWVIISKAAEIIAFFALVFFMSTWFGQQAVKQKEPKLDRNIVWGLITAAVAGLIFYGAGYAAEPLLPALQHAMGAAHDNADGHHDDEANPHAEDAHADGERQHAVAEAGAMVMPFDLEKTTHVFEATANGGLQQVVAKDADDTAQIELIRSHLSEEATRFASGDFSDPAQIHGEEMPGLATLSANAEHISVDYSELSNGAQIIYTSDDAELVEALHLWFEAQLSDHGDHATNHAHDG